MLKKKAFFFVPYLLLLAVGTFVLIFFSKTSTHLFFNSYHNSFFDFLFKYITWFGDGVFAVLAIISLFLYRIKYGWIAFWAFILSTIVTQSLKRLIFEETLRPGKFFEGTSLLRIVPDLHLYSYYSFPSGHSSGAFCIFLCFALFTGKKWLQFACFLMAFLVAHSRLYLSQHFLIDIYFGSLFGVIITLIVYFWFQRSKWRHKPWMEQSLVTLLKK